MNDTERDLRLKKTVIEEKGGNQNEGRKRRRVKNEENRLLRPVVAEAWNLSP